MTTKEFNEKYKNFIEERFYGLDIDIPAVTIFLDEIFEDVFTKVPGFKFSQIKLKFNRCCFYADLSRSLTVLIEEKINKLVDEFEKSTVNTEG